MDRKQGCCGEDSMIDFSKAEIPQMAVDFGDVNFWIAAVSFLLTPLFWNLVARYEYRTRELTQLFGSPHRGCAALAVSVMFLTLWKVSRFHTVVTTQPEWPPLQNTGVCVLGWLVVFTGTTLVLSSSNVLGFYGTYMGDYFGILLKQRVTSFPFNIMENPMYWGTTLNFLGASILYCSQAGLLLSGLAAMVYKTTIIFEEPFTSQIYSSATSKEKVS